MRVIKDAAMPDGIDSGIVGQVTSKTISYAAIVIATIPIVCLYPLIQGQFAKGAVVGSIKG
jgi:ABC-type glycerol-3-phosphate transport system permease component